MKDDAYFYLCAFHANVDRSEDTIIRQRYAQDLYPFLFFIYFPTYYIRL